MHNNSEVDLFIKQFYRTRARYRALRIIFCIFLLLLIVFIFTIIPIIIICLIK